MGESNEGRIKRNRAMEKLYQNYPIDLLQRFMADTEQQQDEGDDLVEGELEEIELNLGLSLGGRFGIDKKCSDKLIRSASVASSTPLIIQKEDCVGGSSTMNSALMEPVLFPMLVRTSSLPTGTEEEWRKRKGLQTLRRMEAKRRRSEKSAVAVKSEDCLKGNNCRNIAVSVNLRDNKYIFNASAAGGGGKLGDFTAGGLHQNSQGSAESQGGSSSGMSDNESKQLQGSGSAGELINPASIQSLQERSNRETSSLGKVAPRPPNTSEMSGGQMGMSAMGDMPCLFTKGDGLNGRRIDGILYNYRKGEEVRIMCVCHGRFLSPAEFVEHAGGSDVAHPLRHIVINPSSNSFL